MIPHLADTPVLTTERLTLRAPAPRDWRAFGHVIGHWVLRGFGMFIFTLKGRRSALGMAGPWYPAGWPEREIGWSLWPDAAVGKGYAHEAASAALGHAFGALGWDTAVSYVAPENTRSIALAERLGARFDPDATRPEECPECLVYRHMKGGPA